MNYVVLKSELVTLLIAEENGAIREIRFHDGAPVPAGWRREETPVLAEAIRQLKEYLAGERSKFDLPLAPKGTPFQRRVWSELERIPYGETIDYAELARRVESPRGFRAVGQANGRNPIAIVIPCHRVIAADGGIGGYGGGLELKEKLLALEGVEAFAGAT